MRRNSTLKYLVYLAFLVFVAGCDFSSLKDPIIVTEVEDEFNVDMWENLAPTLEERKLIVQIESIKTEKCLNYSIDYQYSKNGNRLKIALNNIIKPLDCVPGEATVKANVNAGSLLNGLYNFNIDLKNTVINNGQLTVLADSYKLNMHSENGFSLKRKELLRVPTDAIWGYVVYQDEGDLAVANQFLNDLKNISQEPNSYRTGYYGYFTIATADRALTLQEQPSNSNSKIFLYQYSDQTSKLKDLVNQYRQNHGNILTIKLFTSKGETI